MEIREFSGLICCSGRIRLASLEGRAHTIFGGLEECLRFVANFKSLERRRSHSFALRCLREVRGFPFLNNSAFRTSVQLHSNYIFLLSPWKHCQGMMTLEVGTEAKYIYILGLNTSYVANNIFSPKGMLDCTTNASCLFTLKSISHSHLKSKNLIIQR